MALDTSAGPTGCALTRDLHDDLAAAPSRGVERAVDERSLGDAAAILERDPADIATRDLETWLLHEGSRPVSALLVSRDRDRMTLVAVATNPDDRRRGHAGHLLRAVLGHYALEGVEAAALVATPESERLFRGAGFS
jgi:ribosomal protein S18 acetylase RimI-like enzyme